MQCESFYGDLADAERVSLRVRRREYEGVKNLLPAALSTEPPKDDAQWFVWKCQVHDCVRDYITGRVAVPGSRWPLRWPVAVGQTYFAVFEVVAVLCPMSTNAYARVSPTTTIDFVL